ncbi:choice-of-anchor J domain-containing protein [Polyangium sp. 6x1]|uniref:choice-of-anchor J domain-containing protein n=1 Tax=Polyangium sp. 6x1 TaxID=3042689 RepID=UPI002482CC9A|nr:choice-of-anchor J domain-containing protein [Polyangium sp. 6x1]MDI1442624.1 immune inhibitor A [Polyangium sp. 6x1]
MDDDVMLGCIRSFLPAFLFVPVLWTVAGCEVGGEFPVGEDAGTSSSSSSGTGGSDLGPCGVDCSKFETPQCAIAVCNTGQVIGPLNTCVVIAAPQGTACDDGKFCTANDTCDGEGTCVGGPTNHCGINPSPCSSVICYEGSKSCDVAPVNDGTECTPTDLCQINGVCKLGECIGEPKPCGFSPQAECNTVSCDSATGKCIGKPDPTKDDAPCVLTGDLCNVNRKCSAGQCVGGVPVDCTALDVGCQRGECNPANGLCAPRPAPVGTSCAEGVAECQVGACDVKGVCIPSLADDGSDCNDYNACTTENQCMAGVCGAGVPVSSCSTYLHEGFETCPSGWTLGGDWECGKPENVGPAAAHIGTNCIGTQIDDLYHVNQLFSSAVADSPTINLTGATKPTLSFWAWDHTEGGTFDGWNLRVSKDGGQSFSLVTTVTPAYSLNILSQQAWGGNHSVAGWQNYSADLSAYAGQSIILRFAFRSDGAGVYPGVYVDEVVVAEPPQIPMYITTTSPLTDVYAGMDYSTQITKIGGSNDVVWSIKPGGLNTGWLNIDSTGRLYGAPTAAESGPVSVTVKVHENLLPSNYAEKTFIFTVKPNAYYTSFEGECPNGWTLTGDWQCGVPMNVGPAAAYLGTQCLATQIAANYSILQTWAGTTATSPDIDLTGAASPKLTFRMWLHTEGSTWDGVNLKVSTDGGMSYSVLNSVVPVYPLTIAGEPAWGGNQSAFGWQLFQADLSAYAGQIIRLRFGFQSDNGTNHPGAYIDDFFIQ